MTYRYKLTLSAWIWYFAENGTELDALLRECVENRNVSPDAVQIELVRK